jgi:hypothetical protein
MKLNKQQYLIINDNTFLTKKQAMCIIACAGSGKTTTLIEKIIYMINILNCDPTEFYITTFTKNATNELKKRLLNNLPLDIVDDLTIGTFHSIAYTYLKNNNKLMKNNVDIPVDSYLYNYYEYLKETDDIKYKYIFIDEYQDINEIQNLIIKKISTNAKLLVTVGDDQQNIYTFRNTSIKYILNFKEEYDGIYNYLTTNYRSNADIVTLGNTIIKLNSNKIEKEMLIGSNEELMKPKLNIFYSERDEENHVIKEIIKLMKNNINFNQIAILSRTNKKLYKIENTLAKYNIPTKNLETIQDNINHINSNKYENRIILSTVHGSKGLEFDYVFIIGFVDGHFPLLLCDIEEERRLFYVAVTRAKKSLEISCMTHKKTHLPSRFIQEICNVDKNLLIINSITDFSKIKYSNFSENIFIQNNVTSIIKNINYDDILRMKKLNILPDYENIEYTTEKIHDNLEKNIINSDKSIITNIDNLFGIFIDTYITRSIQKLIGDIFVYDYLKYDLMLIEYNGTLTSSIKSYLNDNNKKNITVHQNLFKEYNCNLLNDLSENNLAKLINTISIIRELKINNKKSIFKNKYLSKNFKKQLKCSYNNFIDSSIDSVNILWDILIVSFIKEIDIGRYAIQYIIESLKHCSKNNCISHCQKNKVDTPDELSNEELQKISKSVIHDLKIDLIKLKEITNNKEWFNDINSYINTLVIDVNYNIKPQYYLRDTLSNINGYSDIIINNEEIMDIKCTNNKKPQLEYLLQVLIYMAIYNHNDINATNKKINKVSIYNPIYGVKYTWTLEDYSLEQQRNLLDYLVNKKNNL